MHQLFRIFSRACRRNINRISVALITLFMAATANTAWATVRTVTYTIGYKSGSGYYLTGDDGTQSAYWSQNVNQLATLNLTLGSDVTIRIASADGKKLNVGGEPESLVAIAGFNYSFDNDIDVTVSSKSHYICHFKMIGIGECNYKAVQTSMESLVYQQSSTLNWRSNAQGSSTNGNAGKFIVTYCDSPAYRITYELNGSKNAAANLEWYESATGLKLADPTYKAGYDFGGWYDNDGFSGSPITSIAAGTTGAKILYAKWTIHTYTITYEKNGGTMPTLYIGKYTVEDPTFSLPTPTRSGYDFYGWYADADFASGKVTQIKKGTTGDKTFYAKWVASSPDGSKDKPYKIESEADLIDLRNKVNSGVNVGGKYYQQTKDITITEANWTPIGNSIDHNFNGNYDGGGYTISGININRTESYTGLFGCVTGTSNQHFGCIQNIVLVNSNIKGAAYTGGIVGGLASGHVLNCHVRSSVSVTGTSGKRYVGGVVGYMFGGIIHNCTSMASVKTGDLIGGIVGFMKNDHDGTTATVIDCFSFNSDPIGKKYSGTATNVERVYIVKRGNGNVTLPEDVPTTDGFLYNGVRYYKAGAVVPFTVNLTEEPGYTVTVSYKPSGSAEVTISPDDFGDYYFIVPAANKSFLVKATKTQNMAKLTDDEDLSALMVYAGKTCTVAFSREFTEGKASTVCLPFAYVKKKGDGGFYEFTDITKNDKGEYVATMTDPGVTTLTPNQPYLYMPNATGTVDFGGTYEIPASLTAGSTTSGDWTFCGTYEVLKYGTAPMQGPVYGFASTDKVVDGVKVSAGEFVKAKEGAGVKSMRCFLIYGNPSAGTRAADDLPQTITVRFLSSTGDTTAIGTLDTQTGEITTANGWYTLTGTRLPAKPTQRGIYIHNGKKIAIK